MLVVTCDGGKTKSTPSPTDLDWTVRLDWSLTISKRVFKKPDFATKKVGSSVIRFGV